MRIYEFAGLKRNQNSKLHITDNEGNVFCGIKSFWMDANREIIKIEDKYFVQGKEHLFPISDKRSLTCKKCYAKLIKKTPPTHD